MRAPLLATRQRSRGLSFLAAVWLLFAFDAVSASAQTSLADKINSILAGGDLRKADVGIHVVASGSGRVIYRRNAMHRFIAASNEKLVTAATALDALGDDYEFETAVYARGAIADGVLRGDLILRGGGDPTLGGRYDDEDALEIFKRWARVLRAKGLRRVAGDVVADDTFFDRQYRHPRWPKDQAWKWYCTSTSALSINDNCVQVTVKPGAAAGAGALLELSPSTTPVKLLNLCKTSGKRHAIWFDREAGSNVIKVGGYVRLGSAGYSHKVTVPDPPLYAATVLRQALEEDGISIKGQVRLVQKRDADLYEGAQRLCVRKAALLPVLRTMVKRSHNHYAEQIIKTVGAETSGVRAERSRGAGSWEAGLGRAARLLRSLGFRDAEFRLDDGSGLSRQNMLPPALLTTLLTRMRRSPYDPTFASLLAVAGEDGTLARRLTEEPYRGNVRAKTGYLSRVGALSGYATTRSGIEVAFSILINDPHNPPGTYSMRQKLDTVCRAIVDYAE